MIDDGTLLFHGSFARVDCIDLARCAEGKDFGRGYYLTTDYKQAVEFVPNSIRKAKSVGALRGERDYGYVMCYRFHAPVDGLLIHEFASADAKWLRFISSNRRRDIAGRLSTPEIRSILRSDVIVGKVADDATNRVITAYLNGLYGEVGTRPAEEMAISLLLPERLKDQLCFRSSLAVDCLTLEGVERCDS